MNATTRRIVGVASALALGLGLIVSGPVAPASAALTCPGGLIANKPINNAAGTRLANIGIYKSGTRYCAVLVKQGPVYGVATRTFLKIERIPYNGGRVVKDQDGQNGAELMKYQTNAVDVDGANARVYVWGYTTSRAGTPYEWSGYVKR